MSDNPPQRVVTHDEHSQIENGIRSLCGSKKEKVTFDDFPFEIRHHIFELCGFREYLAWKPKGERRPSPYQSLLTALRPQTLAYQQMLQMSYELDTIYLEIKNNWSLEGMPVTVRRMVKKLHIIVEEVDPSDKLAVVSDPACIAFTVEHATNIREVTLELQFGSSAFCDALETDYVSVLPKWISRFNRLARLEFVLTGLSWDRLKAQQEVAEGVVGLVSRKLDIKVRSHRGVSAQRSVYPRFGELEIQQKVWEWVAEKRKVIDCSKLICEE